MTSYCALPVGANSPAYLRGTQFSPRVLALTGAQSRHAGNAGQRRNAAKS